MSPAEPLKLVALDEEDLAVLSAHAQDAVLKVGDIAYRPAERRFALAINRFVWVAAAKAGRRRRYNERRRTVLHFDRVLSVKYTRLKRSVPDAVLSLLAIRFEPIDPPAGLIILTFAGGGAIRLAVECIEAYLTDLGAVWSTRAIPAHDLDAVADEPASG
jgi:hypothetical protein